MHADTGFSIMQNLSKIFVRKSSQSFIACLYAHIETIGVYKCTLDLGPFDLEICDVGGARAMRKKLIHCMKDLDYAIYVADLNGYCQNLQEDLDAVGYSTWQYLPPLTTRSESDVGITTAVRKSPQDAGAGGHHGILISQ